eukprot:5671634-Ditylum_brightwellii.AAC.1
MSLKLNVGTERNHNTIQEGMKKKDHDRRSIEIDMPSNPRSHNITKGTRRDGKESGNNTLSTKSNNGIEVGSNNTREEEDQPNYKLENLEKTETGYLRPEAQENRWCPNDVTQTHHETQLTKGSKERRQLNQVGIAEIRSDSTNNSPK